MIVFSTPMFSGLCTAEYFNSCLDLRGSLLAANVGHTWLVTTNESLITRARNTSVARFMFDPELKDYTHFCFIDGDIEFTADDVAKLYNMDVDIATAAYPMKREEAGVTAWKDGKLVDLDKLDGQTSIDYAGTGFLMIKRHVFDKMAAAYPELRHKEGHVGECFAFFDTFVTEDEDWEDRFYCSEDYAFCQRWKDIGGKITLDPSIRLGHVGRRVYR